MPKSFKEQEVKECQWGMVRVVKGRHKGKVGFYDDDLEPGIAVVYLKGEGGIYAEIKLSHLAPILDNPNRHPQADIPQWLVREIQQKIGG